MEKEKVIQVENLTISFRTNNGYVKAVRDVSFDLYKGETLAIVGESGSGKSVTNRAIMGILSGNAVIDDGKILYRNQDLTRVTEADFHLIRGNQIGMIFQDPLSALNPTMKIGKQITEAMLVNGNRIKNKLNNLYHYEYHSYINEVEKVIRTKERMKFKINELKKQVDPKLTKEEFTQQKAEVISKYLPRIELAQKEIPLKKKAYLTAKASAKEQIKKDINEKKQVLKAENDELNVRILASKEILNQSKQTQAFKDSSVEYKKAVNKYLVNKFCLVPIAKIKLLFVKEGKAEKVQLVDSQFQEIKDDYLNKKASFGGVEYRNKLDDYNKLSFEKKELREKHRRFFRVTHREAYEKAISIMNEVGITEPEKRFAQYPFQFSGGMRQRIVIAIALTANPEVLICDEPTTALDVTIQAQILDLIKQIKKERNLSVIFITHDLGVVANMADRLAVMYAGKIVEYGELNEIFYDPKHPYTWALLSSVPDLDTKDKLLAIPGTPPDMLFPPKGDAFAERNKFALKIDYLEQPPFFKVTETHYAATWLLHPDAPKIKMPKIIQDRIERFHVANGISVDNNTSEEKKSDETSSEVINDSLVKEEK
jgi:oligopeptide transport system ATP-binding protein